MKVKYRTNLWAGILSLLAGLVVFFIIPSQIGTEYSSGYGITSRTVPYAASVVFMAGGVILMLQSLVLKRDTIRELDLAKEGKALGYMAVFAVFLFLFDISFLLSSSFLGIATLLFTKSKKKLYYVIVIITVIVLYLLFTQVLHVKLK